MLLDTSGTYAKEVSKAQNIANFLLGTLQSGDSLGLARIDSDMASCTFVWETEVVRTIPITTARV